MTGGHRATSAAQTWLNSPADAAAHWLKTLIVLTWVDVRSLRGGLIGVGSLGLVYGVLNGLAYLSVVDHSAAQQIAFGREAELLGRQVSYLLPLPVHPETYGGYAQWRVYGIFPVFFGFWAVMAASGFVREHERRGLIEQWLTAGASRAQVLASAVLGFLVAAAAAVALSALGVWIGAQAAGMSLSGVAIVAASVPVLAVAASCFSITLLVSQAVQDRRHAAGLGGAVLLGLFLLNSGARSSSVLGPWSKLSPFYLYDRTAALVPGGSLDGTATATLGIVCAAAAAVSLLLFVRRDIGAGVIEFTHEVSPRPGRELSANPLLQLPIMSSLYENRRLLGGWMLGLGLLGAFFVSLVRPATEIVLSTPGLGSFLAGSSGDPHVAILSFFWFGVEQLLLALYAVTQVAVWAGDDGNGRLEMLLSTPVPRWRVVVDRSMTLLAAITLLAGTGYVAVAAETSLAGIAVDAVKLLVASILLIPLAMSFGGVGAACVSLAPRLAPAFVGTIAVTAYLQQQFGPLLKLPAWALDLSLFQLYGAPLLAGVSWKGLSAMVAITFAGFVVAARAMHVRDVGT
jgi:ABC-2 type transport system permease protein